MVLQNQLRCFDLLSTLCLMHREVVYLLCCKGVFLAHAELGVQPGPPAPSLQTWFSGGVIPPLVQDLAFLFVELHKGSVIPFLQPDKVLLNGSRTVW